MNELKDKKSIQNWLYNMGISDYTIHDNLTVDVNTNVYLASTNITHFPFKFNHIYGDFICCNNQLKSLKNAPTQVFGMFDCANNELTSLDFCPQKVEVLDCSFNPLQLEKFVQIELDFFVHYVSEQKEQINFLSSFYDEFRMTKGKKQVRYGVKLSSKKWNETMNMLKEKDSLESALDNTQTNPTKKLKV
jgi:hypothetical protein